MAGDLKISGLASGIAFDELVAKMVEAESYQAKKLESWKSDWQKKVDTLRELSARIASLQTANNTLKKATSFISRMVSATNSNVADISVDSTASVGAHKLDVAENIKHKVGSTGYDQTDVLTFGIGENLEFIDGSGEVIYLHLEGGSYTLDDIADLINIQDKGAKAEVVSNGDQVRLVIMSSVGGSEGEIRFTQDNDVLKFTKNSYNEQFSGSPQVTGVLSVSGDYNGHNSKRINFTVEASGVIEDGGVRIRWDDLADGKSGIITLPTSGEAVLFQGLSLQIDDETAYLARGEKFSMNVYAPNVQQGQDRGLAQSAQIAHSGLSGANATVTDTAGIFQYRYRGVDVSPINVPENTTLEGLAKLINESAGNPGVRATIINDGSGGANAYHLIITGVDSGTAYQIEVIQSDLDYIQPVDFSVTRKATNAFFKIDEYPPGADNWIQKSSNLISDIVEGASIRLKDIGTTNFTITNNDDDMADKVQAFVDEYNAILEYIDEITKVVLNDEEKADITQAGVLVGNYAVNMLRSALRSFVGTRASGFDADNDMYSLLNQIGIRSNDNRRLDFDRDGFKRALNANPEEVIQLLSADCNGYLDNNAFIYMSGTNDTQAGLYDFKVEYDSADNIIGVSYEDKTTGKTYTSVGNTDIRISADKQSFTVFAGSARGVAIQGVSPGTGEHLFTLSVKDGKAKSFDEEINRLFDEHTGLTKVLEKNYENIIRNIDVRIDREYLRVLQVKSRLERRFANLEVNMQNYNGQMERLQQQLAQLSTN